MNRRIAIPTLLLCAAAFRAAPAAAQTDTATVAAPATAAAAETGNTQPLDSHVPRVRRSLNVISYEEVRRANVGDVAELIHNLRPSWLRTPRGAASAYTNYDIAVFKDGVRLGSREALTTIPITAVRTIRYYSATEARQKFGGETGTGAIEISSH